MSAPTRYRPRVSENNDSHAAWKPARDCLHEGACSSPSRWLCHEHDGLHFRAGFELRKWCCACGPCHDADRDPPAALVFKSEPAATGSRPCACGEPSTRATWVETDGHDMVSPVTYACDEHQAQR